MNRVLTLRVVASFVGTSALGGCAYYSSMSSGSAYSDTGTTSVWLDTPHWGEWWREWRNDYAGREPPPTPIEVIPDSPGTGYLWVGGRWRWHDDTFEWVNGSWEKPPARTHVWIPGRWDFDSRGWYYIRGRWQ